MKLSNSYQSLLITSLIFGIVLLTLASISLKTKQQKTLEKYDIAIIEEEIPEIEEKPDPIEKDIAISTHKAYNEAKKFINEIEQKRASSDSELEDKLNDMDHAIEESLHHKSTPPAKISENKKKEVIESNDAEDKKGNNKNSTNSYRLVNRKAMYFPNPVYLCDAFGKVVVQIDVDNTGKVTSTSISSSLSTTKNECLLDVAINYAKKTRFNTDADKAFQKGTITYIFPGQK